MPAVRAETDDAKQACGTFQAASGLETPESPDYMKFLNGAAAREREKNGSLLPKVDGSTDSATAAEPSADASVTGTNLDEHRAEQSELHQERPDEPAEDRLRPRSRDRS
jgi:hypothetical protein